MKEGSGFSVKDEVISGKLDSLVRCIERLKSKNTPSMQMLEADVDLQDVVIINLERLVQVSVDIAMLVISKTNLAPVPSTMSQSFEILKMHKIIPEEICMRLQKAVGFRNLCVHEYDKIHWGIVHTILGKHLGDFVSFGKIVEGLNR